jgi:thiol-disulfide isomerase/thioredoxin
VLLILLACADPEPSQADSGALQTGDSADSVPPAECPAGPTPPDDPIEGYAPRPAETWSGSVTWTVDFNLLAEVGGHHDCTYTRDYPAMVEVTDEPWLCPACSVLVKGTATIVSGYEDCYAQLSDADAEHVEQLGLGAEDGAPAFFRSGNENVALASMGTGVDAQADAIEVAWSDEPRFPTPDAFTLSAEGRFQRALSDTVEVSDPQDPRQEPYTCGWPLFNPGGPNTSWELRDGEVFPNFRLQDQCDDPVSLWDFRGRYVVIDASSPNCGPCQAMAAAAPAFEAAMRDQCVDVASVTLLNASLSAVNLPAPLEDLQGWAEYFGLDGPVLADLGLGYALLPAYLSYEGGMSLPSWVVLDPEGRLLGGGSGYSDDAGGFAEIDSIILADLAARSAD